MNNLNARIRLTAHLLTFGLGIAALAHADGGPHFAPERPIDTRHIRLDARVDLKKKSFAARAALSVTTLRETSHIQLNAVGLSVTGVTMKSSDGLQPIECDYTNDGTILTINPGQPLPAGTPLEIEIDYSVKDPPSGLSFFAPSPEDPDAPYVVWSQGQAITNRYWIPCFDHPNDMQTSEIICTVDAPNIANSNGRLVEQKDNPDGTRTFHWLQDKPHVSYLITLVVGEFASKKETWRGKPVAYYVRDKFKDQIDNSFSNTLPMLDFFSDKIGVEYPWDKYDQVCCYNFGGGMENTSATTLTEGTLHDDRAHLDDSSDGLVAHELAHQWWGDLLTCRDWSHIWLNEGFATYFEAMWDEHHNGPDEFACNMDRNLQTVIGAEELHPIVWRDYTDPDEQFDYRAYDKASWVLHMIRRRLGDDVFWKAINVYATRFAHKNVETIDLQRTIEEVSSQSFGRFFYDWTQRPGHPKVSVECTWEPDDMMAKVKVRQTQKGEAFHFPLTLEFSCGKAAEIRTMTHDITEKQESFFIPLPADPRMIRVDPQNAVMMDLSEKKARNLWEAQLKHDPNVVARMRAAKHFGDSAGDADVELLCACLNDEPFWAVRSAIAAALGETSEEPARISLLAALKDKHPKVRAAVARALSNFPDESDVTNALKTLIDKGDPSYRVEAAAITSYADVTEENVREFLATLLDRDSDNEIIRGAALEALGKHGDASTLATLIDWTRPAKHFACRSGAVRAIAELLTNEKLSIPEAEKTKGVDAIVACLKKSTRRVQRATMEALEKLGAEARVALPELEKLARIGGPRIRAGAKRAVEKIKSSQPAAIQVDDLRDELKSLRQENEKLKDRLEKLEGKIEVKNEKPAPVANHPG